MNTTRMSVRRLSAYALAALLVPLVISCISCGSGGGGASSRAGTLTLTVHWPSRSRLIPVASNSIQATLKLGTTTVDTKLLARPGNGATQVTVSWQNLTPGSYVLDAKALPNTNGSGVAQAAGSAPVTVAGGQTASVTVTMDSTIDHVTVTPANPSIAVGADQQMTATCYDLQNNVVLVGSNNIVWTTADAQHVTVSSTGLAHGVAATTTAVAVSARETESTKTGSTNVTVTAQAGCTPGTNPGAGALANSAWPRMGHDNFNSSRGAGSGATGVLKYSTTTAAGGVGTPVLAADGTLYVGSNVDHKVRAINSSDGSLKWSFDTTAGITQSPLLGSNGYLYIGDSNTSISNFYAIDAATGASKWTVQLQDPLTPAIGADGTLYVPCFNQLVALDGTTGAQKWTFAASGLLIQTGGAPTVNPTDGTILFSGQDGNVYGLDPKCGTPNWKFTLNAQVLSHPTLVQGSPPVCYVHSNTKLYKLNAATGSLIWQADIAGGGFTQPAVGTNGTIFCMGGFGQLYAFDPASATPLWSYNPGQQSSSGVEIAVAADNTVYYTGNASQYRLFAVNGNTGALKWTYTFPQTSPIGQSSPIVDASGVIYVRSYADGKLYAIQ